MQVQTASYLHLQRKFIGHATNATSILFILSAVFMGFFGLLLYYMEPYLPTLITRSYRYGKFSTNSYQPLVAKVEVPKRWFKHFYVFAAPASTYTLYLVVNRYLWNGDVPNSVMWILNLCMGSNRQPLVSSESTFVATVLLTIQCWKRFYETQYISVFSDKTMNILHYVVGYYHYMGTFMSIVGESQGFVQGSEGNFSWSRITYFQLLCAVIFVLSSYTQFRANCILRGLRQNKDGKVTSTTYKIPHGGLFDYVSGALQFTEIIMYVILSIIMWQCTTYHYVTIWVVTNQIFTAMLTHQWYIQTFQNYPKTRKVLVPHVF